MTESEARAVARCEVGSCLRMVRKTKQVGFEPVFESLHSYTIQYNQFKADLRPEGRIANEMQVKYYIKTIIKKSKQTTYIT